MSGFYDPLDDAFIACRFFYRSGINEDYCVQWSGGVACGVEYLIAALLTYDPCERRWIARRSWRFDGEEKPVPSERDRIIEQLYEEERDECEGRALGAPSLFQALNPCECFNG